MNVARLTLLASCLLLAAASVQAGVPAPGSPQHHGEHRRASLADWQFMRRAAATGHAVVAAGTLAQKNAAESGVRELATALAQGDEAIERQLSLLSLYTQVPLPASPASDDAQAIDALHKLGGEAFDQHWLQEVAALQKRLVDLFQKEAASRAADPGLRSLAREFLPRLQAQLRSTEKLQGVAATAGS